MATNPTHRLRRYEPTRLASFFRPIEPIETLAETQACVRMHVLRRHNNAPRTKDLATHVADLVVDYATPRSKIRAAKELDVTSTSAHTGLLRKARELFVHRSDSGEGGEALLYCLADSVLGLPQLLCKMPLKTSSQMHVHGVDGIHGCFRDDLGLSLYWGESKLHASLASAVTGCVEGLARFLVETGGVTSALERDIQLLEEHIDLDDPELEALVKACLNRDSEEFVQVRYCGIALIGFDYPSYPDPDDASQRAQIVADARHGMPAIRTKLQRSIATHGLAQTTIEAFCIPFDSVETYRTEFLRALGLEVEDKPRRGK